MPGTNQGPLFNMTGRKVLVTGAGRGIGRAVAVELYAQGATVFALSQNPDNLKKLKEECPNMHTICVDLSNWEEARNTIENNVDTVDALINNAAVCITGEFMEITPESFDKMFNVNLKSVINVSQVIAKKMIASGKGGAIVNISSIAGRRAFPTSSVYCCTKAALEMLTKAMAIELGPHKITVNSVCPAGVKTDMLQGILDGTSTEQGTEAKAKINGELILEKIAETTPTRTAFMPMKDVVNAILFFASGATSQITGENMAVDGGILAT